MKNFQPSLFVGIGDTQAYYTLRETYLEEIHIPGEGPSGNAVVNGVYQGYIRYEVRSFHHFNLSQDAAEAIDKGKAASLKIGLPFSCSQKKIEAEMREIKRRTAEEIAEDERVAYERIKLEEEQKRARFLKIEKEKIEDFEKSKRHMPTGAYMDMHIRFLPKSYKRETLRFDAQK